LCSRGRMLALLVVSLGLATVAGQRDIWHDSSVVTEVLAATHGVRIFSVPVGRRTHRVAIISVDPDEHEGALGLMRDCERWRPIKATQDHAAANAFICHFSRASAALELAEFASRHAAALSEAHSITRCKPRDDIDFAPPRSYVTVSSSAMPSDVFHADGCGTVEGRRFFTAVSYPHAAPEWQPSWGGHIEFAAQECRGAADGNPAVAASTPVVLRVSPSFGRVVVFSGPLLHRATQPASTATNNSIRPPPTLDAALTWTDDPSIRWRYSTVMQALCSTSTQPADDDDAVGRAKSSVVGVLRMLAFCLLVGGIMMSVSAWCLDGGGQAAGKCE